MLLSNGSRRGFFTLAVVMVTLSSVTWAEVSESTALAVSSSRGKGNAFNPNISANFLGLLQRGTDLSDDRTVTPRNGISLQEAELQLSADVDPYFRAVALLSVSQDGAGFGIDPEEVFMETIALPRVTLRAGKFKLALGKHNQLHTHAYPFIDAPLIHQALLGEEGLNEAGVSAAALLPVSWYSEMYLQAFDLSNEELFKANSSKRIGGLVRLRNLWDISDDLTVEIGLSGTAGRNQWEQTSSVFGTDLTFKWRPAQGGKYKALIWATEYLDGNRDGRTDATTGAVASSLGGLATWVQYQFAERWWVQARYEHVGLPRSPGIPKQDKESLLVGFFPSEFSGFRVQYDHMTAEGAASDAHGVGLQYNVSIGAHPAHAY